MIYKWWHQFVRRRTKPIPEETAILWKRRLSIAYAIAAWNAFGLVLYSMFQGKADWAHYYGLKTDEEHSVPPGTVPLRIICNILQITILHNKHALN